MTFGFQEITMITLAILLSSIVQGMVGFAVALIAVPLLLQAGLDLPQSIFIVLLCSMIQNVLGLRHTWQDTPILTLTPWAVFRALLILPGYWLMGRIENFSQEELRQLFGIFLFVMIMLQLMLRIRPREKVAAGWTFLAMSLSGVSQGMIGTPGPPIAFWVMAHNWTSRKSRGAMFYLFATGAIPHLLLFCFFSAVGPLWTAALISVCVFPLSYLGTLIGLWAGNRFDRQKSRYAILITLIVLSLALIFAP